MAKTGIHIKRCNVGSVEAHNERKKNYLRKLQELGRQLYFFQDLTRLNKSWVNPMYAGKSVEQHFNDMCQRYQTMTGQAPQLQDRERLDKKTGKMKVIAGWSPIREGCPPIKPDTQLKDFAPFVKWLRSKNLDVIRIDLHHDEGHEDEEGQRIMNHHAHVVIDWTDHQTGKTIKLSKKDMEEMQTVLAESLGMERGAPKADTGRDHVDHAEWRERKAEEHYQQLRDDYTNLVKAYNDLVDQYNDLSEAIEKTSEASKEAELINKQLQKQKALLDAINGQIAYARATTAAMGVGVKAKVISTPKGWVLYAQVGETSLPAHEISQELALAYKSGEIPTEILVAKCHPMAFQPSPEVVEKFVRQGPKR